MINFEGDPGTRQDLKEERIQDAMYISLERTRWSHRESKNPSHPPFTYSMRYFKIPRPSLSLSLSLCHVHSLIYSWIAKIVRSPGPPRVAIRGHRRLQPASKSGSFLFRSILRTPSSLFFQLTKEKRRARRPKERETRWCMCLDIRCTLDRGESIDARYNINAVIIRRHI